MKKIFLLFCLLIPTTCFVYATNYYVAQNDPNASDSNPGTELLPFYTIQAAADQAQAGDVIYVKAGIYRETIIPANSGTAGNPIIFQAFGNDEVTVSGTEEISGWTHHSGSIYKAPMAGNFMEFDQGMSDQIFVENASGELQMMNIARWPNNGLNVSYQKKALTTAASKDGSGPYTGTLTSATEFTPPSIDYTGVEIFYYPDTGKWTWSFTGRVQSVSGNTVVFESNNGSTEDGKSGYAEVSRYFLFNSPELLDAPGEFYHDKDIGMLYLWAPDGNNPSSKSVEAKKRNFAFDLSDKSYIEVKGLNIFGATITTDNQAGIAGGTYNQDGSNSNQYPWRGSGSVATASHIVLDGLEVLYPTHSLNQELHFYMQHGQHSGIVLGGYDHVVKNCHIQYCSDNGISVLGYRHKIINNVIEDVAYYARGYAAIAFGGSGTKSYDHEVGYNTIRRCGRSGIENHNLANSDVNNLRARIHHNDVSMVMMQDNDGAGIRSTHDRDWVRIDHNYVHDINNRYINAGIYVDWGNDYIIDHNVVENVWSSFHMQHGYSILMYNNTALCQNPNDAPAFISGPFNFSGAADKSNSLLQNNIAVYHEPPDKGNYSIYQKSEVYDIAEKINNLSGVSSASVGFVNEPNDLALTSDASSAIDQGAEVTYRVIDGVFVPAFNDEINGSTPDLGAYEYGKPKWLAGASEGGISYKLTIVQGNNGTVSPSTGFDYPENAIVDITAKGNLGYAFSHWTGDVPTGKENDNPLFLAMDGNKSVTANYVTTTVYSLTYSADANGSAVASPTGPDYNQGTFVSLTAFPNVTYEPDKWIGDVPVENETDNPLTITMNADKNIQATFKKRTDIWYDFTDTSFVTSFEGTVHSNDEVECTNNGSWTGITFAQDDGLTITNAGKKWSDIHYSFLTTSIDLSSNPVLKFTLKSDKSYTYNVRLGDADGDWGNSSKQITINGDNQFHDYEVDFSGSSGLDLSKISKVTWWFGDQDDDLGTWVLSSLMLGTDSEPPVLVTAITIDQGDLTKETGDSDVQLTVTVEPDDAIDQSVSWSPTSGSVAYVDATGLLTIVGAGTQIITATANDGSGVSGSIEVTVTDPPTGDPITISFQDGVSPDTDYNGTFDTQLSGEWGWQQDKNNDNADLSFGQYQSSLIKWDISSIPDNATITAAEITFFNSNLSDNEFEIYEVKKDWIASEATWNIAKTGQNWEIAGAKGTTDVGNTVLGTINMVNNWNTQTYALNSNAVELIQNWIDGSKTNNGFIIQDYGSTTWGQFKKEGDTDANKRPKLTITYVATEATESIHIEAEEYDAMSGINNQSTYIGACETGDRVKFSNIDLTGFNEFKGYVSRNGSGYKGDIEIRLGSATGTLIGTLQVQGTGDWSIYEEQTTSITETSGTYDVYLVFNNNQYGVCNLDWFEFGINNNKSANNSKQEIIPFVQDYSVSICPNPVNSDDDLTIELKGFEEETEAIVFIVDISGRVAHIGTVKTKNMNVVQHSINTGILSGGIYLMTIRCKSKVFNQRLIVE